MNKSTVVAWLSWLIAGLALVAAAAGLLWQDDGAASTFTTVRGQTALIYGEGLYRYDSLFTGAGNKGLDVLILVFGVPLPVVVSVVSWRGSLRGRLLQVGTLGFFLYVYGSYALGAAAYNELFLLYVVLFSASLYAFVLAFVSVDTRELAATFSPSMPQRGPALFMIGSGLTTLLVWAGPLVVALMEGKTPERLDHYTTKLTEALDLATVTPAALLSGLLMLRRAPLGYLIGLSMLVLEAMLAPMIALQTVSQSLAGVSFPPGQIVGPIAGFSILALLAIWIIVAIIRNISDSGAVRVEAAPRETGG